MTWMTQQHLHFSLHYLLCINQRDQRSGKSTLPWAAIAWGKKTLYLFWVDSHMSKRTQISSSQESTVELWPQDHSWSRCLKDPPSRQWRAQETAGASHSINKMGNFQLYFHKKQMSTNYLWLTWPTWWKTQYTSDHGMFYSTTLYNALPDISV